MRILLTGERGVGKSTLARSLFEKLTLRPAGFRTLPLVENGQKSGYFLQDLQTGQRRLFAHREFEKEKRLGGFGVRESVFNEFGVEILKNLPAQADWILLDEIGIMEQGVFAFLEALIHVWQSSQNQLWVVQKRSPFLQTLAALPQQFLKFEVTPANRAGLLQEILNKIRNG